MSVWETVRGYATALTWTLTYIAAMTTALGVVIGVILWRFN